MKRRTQPQVALWMYQDLGGDCISRQLASTLEKEGISIIKDFDLRHCTLFNGQVWTENGLSLSNVDLLFQMNADHQTPYQNDLLRILELQGVQVVNNMAAFNNARDKLLANTVLLQEQITVPIAIGLDKKELPDEMYALTENWAQILLKPRGLHGGKSIVKWNSFDQLKDGWQLIANRTNQYYIESFIPFIDHDYRVEVIDGKFAGSYGRKKAHEFKTNISSQGGLMGLQCPQPCIEMALHAVKILGLDCSIVDMVQHQITGQYYILEVNPALGVFNEAAIKTGVPIYSRGNESYKTDDLKLSLLHKMIIKKLKKSHHATDFRRIPTDPVLSKKASFSNPPDSKDEIWREAAISAHEGAS